MTQYLDTIGQKRAEQQQKREQAQATKAVVDAIGAKIAPKDVRILGQSIDKLNSALNELKSVDINLRSDAEMKQKLDSVIQAVSAIKVSPVVKVPEPKVVVNEREVDLRPLLEGVKRLESAFKGQKTTLTLEPLQTAIDATTKAIKDLSFPAANFILPFKDTEGGATQVQLNSSGDVPVSINGDVNTSSSYTEGETTPNPPTGEMLVFDNGGTIQAVSDADPLPVADGAVFGLVENVSDAVRGEDQAFTDAGSVMMAGVVRRDTPANSSDTDGDVETLQVSAGRLWTSAKIDTALPAGTNAIGKLAANSGVDIGDVTINNTNLDANLQVGDSDVSDTNPVPVAAEKASSASTSTGVTVGSSSTTVIASNASRKAVIIVNDSDETIYLKYGTGATSNSGIRINASGGVLREEMYTGIITGICASGGKVLTVTEL